MPHHAHLTSTRRGHLLFALLATTWLAAATLALPGRPVGAEEKPDSAPAADEPVEGTLTWGIAPASKDKPDGRPTFNYRLDPGDELTDRVAVMNYSEEPMVLDLYASDAFTTAAGGFDLLAADQDPIDVGTWIAPEDDQLEIEARSRVIVPFRITVPDNATPGDHVGGIVASMRSPGDEESQVLVDRRVGARIYLQVTGDLDPRLVIEDASFDYDRGGALGAGSVDVRYTIVNRGNLRLGGRPKLTVAGPFGIGRQRVALDEFAEVLPGGELELTGTVDGVQPLGRLTATLDIEPVPPEDTKVEVADVSTSARLWAVPWLQLVLLILVLIALRQWRRRRKRRAAAAAEALETAHAEGRAEAVAADS